MDTCRNTTDRMLRFARLLPSNMTSRIDSHNRITATG
jgi:hypothetical protein